jgi:hypothetical protein
MNITDLIDEPVEGLLDHIIADSAQALARVYEEIEDSDDFPSGIEEFAERTSSHLSVMLLCDYANDNVSPLKGTLSPQGEKLLRETMKLGTGTLGFLVASGKMIRVLDELQGSEDLPQIFESVLAGSGLPSLEELPTIARVMKDRHES